MTPEDFILKFQLYPLPYRFGELVGTIRSDSYRQATEYSRYKLVDLLIEITKGTLLFESPNLNYEEIFEVLFSEFANRNSNGILRNSMFELLKTFINKCPLTNL
jgi:hypothetical protein